jgi:hypothetical protein
MESLEDLIRVRVMKGEEKYELQMKYKKIEME